MENLVNFGGLFECNMGKICLKSLKKFHNMTFQVNITTGESETHGSARKRSVRVAQAMKSRGLGVGKVMILCGKNHNDSGIPLLAALYIGTSVMPLSMDMSPSEMKHLVAIGRPDIIFCDAEIASKFDQVTSEYGLTPEIVVFGEPTNNKYTPFSEFLKPTEDEDAFQASQFDPATTTAFIVSSSGTTGLPKGVCLTHKNMAVQILLPALMTKYDFETEHGILIFSTYVWLSGIIVTLHSCIFGTTRIQTHLPFSPEIAFDAITNYKPRSVLLAPISVTSMLKHPDLKKCDFSSLKTVMCIGSNISYENVEEFQKYVKNGKVSNIYGITEVCGTICLSQKYKRNSCGKPLPWIKSKIVNPETEEELGVNLVGEIRLKSSLTLFKEYHNNPEATYKSFDDDGWFLTGDLGYFDEEGDLFIVDRIKEMLKYRNMQVAPAEIEQEISKIPGVHTACVVGIPHSDDGDHPAAFVQLIPGSKLSEEDIKNHIKKNLSDAKQLRGGVVFLNEFPATHSGKIDRKFLKNNKISLFRSNIVIS